MVNTQLSDSPPPYDEEDIHLYLRNDLDDDLDDDLDEDENVIDNGGKNRYIEILFSTLLCISFIGIYFAIFFLYTKPYVIDTCINGITNSSCVNEYICDDDNNCGYVNLCKDMKCNSFNTWFLNLFIVTLIPSIIILFIFACICDGLIKLFTYLNTYIRCINPAYS